MKKSFLMLVIAVIISSVAFCQSNPKGNDKQAVQQAINQLIKGLQTNNAKELDHVWASDYTFVGNNGVLTTKAQRLDALKAGKMKYKSISIENVKIRMYGDAAVATFNGEAKFEQGGESLDGSFMATATFVKSNGRWMEAAAESVRITK